MSPGLETRVAAQVAHTLGEAITAKAVSHFDESGVAEKIRLSASRFAVLSKGRHETSAIPNPDRDNLQGADCLRHLGVSDSVLIQTFRPRDGILYSSEGRPVFVGRDRGGEAQYLAVYDPESGRLTPVAGSDDRFGVCLLGQTDRVAVYEQPIAMLRDISAEMDSGQARECHRLALTGDPARSLGEFLAGHPEIRTVEMHATPDTCAKTAEVLKSLGFGEEQGKAETRRTEMHERVTYVEQIPLYPPAPDRLPDGRTAMVCGDPGAVAGVLHSRQGENGLGYQGTCGVVSCQNVLRLFGVSATEDEMVRYAATRGLCSVHRNPEASGATNPYTRARLLGEWGFPTEIVERPEPGRVAQAFEEGHGVIVGVNAGILWDNANFYGNGFSNHAVAVTGTARDEVGGLLGLYICDSGRRLSDDSARFVPADLFGKAVDVPGATVNITVASRKEERI